MSDLFKNYKNEYRDIPDNYVMFLKKSPEYKDIIVLGADNTHSFILPFAFDKLVSFEVSYIQGTEIKLKKYWGNELLGSNWFTLDPNESTETIHVYNDDRGYSKLYEIKNEDIDLSEFKMLKEFDLVKLSLTPYFCVLYYDLNPEDIRLFNNYNTDVYAQLTLKIRLDNNEIICLSDKYKLKIIENINLIGKDISKE